MVLLWWCGNGIIAASKLSENAPGVSVTPVTWIDTGDRLTGSRFDDELLVALDDVWRKI